MTTSLPRTRRRRASITKSCSDEQVHAEEQPDERERRRAEARASARPTRSARGRSRTRRARAAATGTPAISAYVGLLHGLAARRRRRRRPLCPRSAPRSGTRRRRLPRARRAPPRGAARGRSTRRARRRARRASASTRRDLDVVRLGVADLDEERRRARNAGCLRLAAARASASCAIVVAARRPRRACRRRGPGSRDASSRIRSSVTQPSFSPPWFR